MAGIIILLKRPLPFSCLGLQQCLPFYPLDILMQFLLRVNAHTPVYVMYRKMWLNSLMVLLPIDMGTLTDLSLICSKLWCTVWHFSIIASIIFFISLCYTSSCLRSDQTGWPLFLTISLGLSWPCHRFTLLKSFRSLDPSLQHISFKEPTAYLQLNIQK